MSSPSTDRRFGLNSGVALKAPCDLATTANITLSGEQSIDGTTTSDSRVLVKNQTTASENGIYRSDSAAWNREPDFDGNRDVVQGTLISVNNGTANAYTLWRVTTTGTITIGTTSLTIAAAVIANSSLALTAGTGISITGTSTAPVINVANTTVNAAGNIIFSANISSAPVTLTAVSNIFTPDASDSNYFDITLTANSTLANPTNLVTGPLLFHIRENATGGWTLAFGSKYRSRSGFGMSITTTALAKNSIACEYNATDDILICALVEGAA